MVKETLERVDGVEVRRFQYGRFDMLSFLLPGPTRLPPIKKIKRNLSGVMNDARKSGARVSIIAHSYGTYAISNILERDSTVEIDNLILCGSIIKNDFDWQRTRRQVSGRIINDHGVMDIWPIIAKSVTWGYGDTGTYGCGDPIEDRRHSKRHSEFFEREFVEKFWESFFKDGIVYRDPIGDGKVAKSPFWFDLFSLPLRYIILVFLIVIGLTLHLSNISSFLGRKISENYTQSNEHSSMSRDDKNQISGNTKLFVKDEDTKNQTLSNASTSLNSIDPLPKTLKKPAISRITCSNLLILTGQDRKQTQISDDSFQDAKIKYRLPYVKFRESAEVASDNIICEVGPGVIFKAVDLDDGWSEVRLATGHLGFIKTNYIQYTR